MYNPDYLTIAQDYVIVHNKRRSKYRPYVEQCFKDKEIKYSKEFDKISLRVRGFIEKYSLIEPEERLVLAFSCGKDSVFLLNLLAPIFKRNSNEVFVVNCQVFPNNKNIYDREEFYKVFDFYKENFKDFRFEIIKSEPFKTRKTPCFACSIYRRYKLVEYCSKVGAKKLIFGHNLEDLLETVFIMFSKGKKIKLQRPKRYMPPRVVEILDKKFYLDEIVLIKPLLTTSERDIVKALDELSLPYFDDKSFCPYSARYDRTTRGKIDKVLKALNEMFPDFDYNMFKSLCKTLSMDDYE